MKDVAINRKARHDYEIIEKLEVGIALFGSEVKSIRNGHLSLKESFVSLTDNSMTWKQGFIKRYEQANSFKEIDETRDRKLLAHKREIESYKKRVDQKGLTVVVLRVYLSDRNILKMEIALAKGKNAADKRHALKEKDQKRDVDRAMKDY